jgi:hypothetical protein
MMKMVEHLCLGDAVETLSGAARVSGLSWENGSVRIDLTFLETGITPDGKAIWIVSPQTPVRIREFPT